MAKKQHTKDKTPHLPTTPAAETAKRLEDYEHSEPLQLSLFRLTDLKANVQPRYSNTIELYDFMPKYHWGKVERIGGEFLRVLKRDFECRGNNYKIQVAPAVITDSDGKERYYYPSKREELVEDALRRLATTEKGVFLDDRAAVTFTLYQLQQELKKNGHTYSITELKDALYICAKTTLTVTTDTGKNVLISNMFETLGLQTREDWKGTGTKQRAFVRFNSLVSESIKSGAFRQLDYEKAMRYSSVIARQLHKRLSHNFTQAGLNQHFDIKLSTIIRDFGLTEYARPSLNLTQVIKALDEMVSKSVLLNYKVEKILDPSNRNKLLDAKLILTTHPFFNSEARAINDRAGKKARQLLSQEKK